MARRGEIHVELVVGFSEDPKVRALAKFGRDARALRDLYVQMLCYCKRNLTDGLVPAHEVGVLVYPDTPRNGRRDADRLVEVGLAQREGDDYLLPGFLKRNKSRAQIAAESQDLAEVSSSSGRFGNHQRWHVKKGLVQPGCEFCPSPPEDPEPPDTDRPPIAPESGTPIGSDRSETETKTEITTYVSRSATESNAREHALAGPWHSAESHRIAAEFAASLDRRPPSEFLNQLGIQIHRLLDDGMTHDDIRAGLALLRSKSVGPGALPSLVAEAQRKPAGATRRIATTDRKLAEAELLKDNPDPRILALGGLTLPDQRNPPHLHALPGGA